MFNRRTFFSHAALFASTFTFARASEPRVATPLLRHAHPDKRFGEPLPYRKVPGTKGSIALELVGNRLYALENKGLSIYDVSTPAEPKLLGHVGGMGNVRQLAVRGKTAFLTSRQCGLWAVDVSDDSKPAILSNFDAVEMSTGLDVAGDVAFIGNRVYGVQCVDVSDPKKMKHLSSFLTDESQSVYYGNGLLYSGDWAGGEVTVIDVSDVMQPKKVASVQLDGYGDGMVIRDGLLYASTGQHRKSGPEDQRHGAGHGLDIFDIRDPKHPVKLSSTKFVTYYFGPCDYWTPRLSGNYCFASDTINGLFLLDIADPRQPKILGNLVLPKTDPEDPKIRVPYAQIMDPSIPQGDPIASVVVGDGVVYLAGDFTGIYLLELPDHAKREARVIEPEPALPVKGFEAVDEEGFISSGPEVTNPTRGLALHGDVVYTANVWDGLKIYELSESEIRFVGKHPINYAADVKRSGNRLYVAEGQDGIGVYQIESPTQLIEIGRLKAVNRGFSFVQSLWAFDGHDVIVASTAQSSLHVIDFSNPKDPQVLLVQRGVGLFYGPYGSQTLVQNRFFPIAQHCGGWMLLDLNGKNSRVHHHDTFPMCSQTGGATALGDQILIMRAGGYALVDPQRIPKVPQMTRHRFPGQTTLPEDVPDDSPISRAMFPKGPHEGYVHYDAESGRLVVLNRMFRELFIYDFKDQHSPVLLKRQTLQSNAYPPFVWKGRALIPGAYSGLLLEKT